VAKVLTIHDLVWVRFPETTSRYNLLVQKAWTRKAIAEANLIIVNSRSTQQELVCSLGVPVGKTRLIYPGISEMYHPRDRLKAAQYISSKYGVPPLYMAFVGTVEPRKNLRLLVEALRILRNTKRGDCPLLIAGARGWKNSHLFAEIQSAGLGDEEIRFLGYLPDGDLPYFYAGAQVFLFPTLYEGFGLPPLEAMACGTPVIASDAPCMPEVLGDAAILVPPTEAEPFAEAILKVLGDEDLCEAMRAAGIVQAEKFRREPSARLLLDALGEFLSAD
jgi:glycosyltransferase involved in cell wall biosynthesis